MKKGTMAKDAPYDLNGEKQHHDLKNRPGEDGNADHASKDEDKASDTKDD